MDRLRPSERLRQRGLSTAAAIGQCFHTFVFAGYPVLIVVGKSAGVVPLDGWVVARSLILSTAIAAVLLAVSKPLVPELSSRAACLSFVFIAFSLYGVVGGTSTHAGVAVVYTLAAAAIAMLIVRPWRSRPRSSTAANIAACALLASSLYTAAPVIGWQQPWRPSADALIEHVTASAAARRPPLQPDIYYIVLDGFGRPDVLNEVYDLDLGFVVKALEARGFAVPAESQSNYAQTFLSLGSSLNLSYLDSVARTMADSRDRRVLEYLIQNNALTRLAQRAGYEVIAVGSNYSATERLQSADQCRCEQYGLHEIEIAALNLTPLRALPLDRWTYDAHRRKVDGAFRHLENAADAPGPKLVFAHVLSPHPPFVFTPDGGPRAHARRVFGFMDGSHYEGPRTEYVAGYRDQAQFVARRLLALVDAILKRPGPPPAIVVHGDHGPGSMWDWDDVRGGNARERMAIFSAYLFPGGDPPALAAHVSPVNGLRIVANRYLGTALPLLPDLSFASTWRHPYRLAAVASGGAGESSRFASSPRHD